MIKYSYNIAILVLIVIVGFGFMRSHKVTENTAALEYGVKKECSELFGATKEYAASKEYNDECWSCPAGFEKSPLHINPEKERYCRNSKYVDALYHSEPKGRFKNKCETREVWYKNKKCWTCPDGYKPARIKEGDGDKTLCKNDDSYIYRPAIKRGSADCTGGVWSPIYTKKCYKCPEGFEHIWKRLPRNIDPAKDATTCKREVPLIDSIFASD